MKIFARSAAFLALLAIGVLSLLPGDARPDLSPFPGQVQHVVAYAVATVFLVAAFSEKISAFRIVALLTAYGSVLEIGQLWVPGRTARLTDIGADLLGAVIGALIGAFILGRMLPQGGR